MNLPQLSPDERLRAEQIFKRAQRVGWVAYLIFVITASVVTGVVARLVFHTQVNGGFVAGFAYAASILIRNYAAGQVRKAGLSLDKSETQFIPKTAERFEGQPLVYKPESPVLIGRFCLAFCTFFFLFFGWLQLKGLLFTSSLTWGEIGGIAFLGLMWLLSLFLASNPVGLRLDGDGVYSALDNNKWPRRVAWSEIRGVEVKRTYDYAANPRAWILIFRGEGDKILLIGALAETATTRERAEEVIAQVEAKMRGE